MSTTTVEAIVLVKSEIAETLPSRPDRVEQCMLEAEEAMNDLAADRGRVTSDPPRLVEHRPTGLGLVALTFQADTSPR